MASGLRNIVIKFTGETKGLDKAAGAGQKQLSKWQDGFKRFNERAVKASLAVGAAALVVAKDSVQLSRRMDELDTKSKTVFEGQLGKVRKWADANKRAFGTSRREVVGLAADMADLLKPMGFTAKQAAEMSTELLGLSGALAKWSGGKRTAAEVSEILSKALLGERDELKSLGISISEADVQARLAANGTEKLTGKALQQATAVATQQLIMEKSTDAQKAWANGGKKAAEAQNSMSTAVQELREKLASVLGPAIAWGTKQLEKLATWVDKNRTAAITLGATIVGLAGFVLAANAAYKVWIAATRTFTAVQRIMNAVLKMSPLWRIVTVLIAIGTAMVALWQKSATFRRIVKGAFRAVADAVGWVIRQFKNLISWIEDAIAAVDRFLNNRTTGQATGGASIGSSIGNLPGRADGGPVKAGRSYLVGERGREIVTMGGNGHVTPNHELGGGIVVQNLEVKAFSDRFSLAQVQRELAMHGAA